MRDKGRGLLSRPISSDSSNDGFMWTPEGGVCLYLRRNPVDTVSLLSCLRAWHVYCIQNNLHLLGDNVRGTTPYFLRPRDFRSKNHVVKNYKHSFYSRHFFFYARLFSRSLKIVSLGVSTICVCNNQGRPSKNVMKYGLDYMQSALKSACPPSPL